MRGEPYSKVDFERSAREEELGYGSGGSGGAVGDEGPRFLSSRYVLSMRLIFIPQVTLSTFGGQDR